MSVRRFLFYFLTLVTLGILFAGSFPAASAAGNAPRPAAKRPLKKPAVKKPAVKKPTVRLGTAYVAELRRK